MDIFGRVENVGTTAAKLCSFVPSKLHSIIIKATAALYIGGSDVTATNGMPLSAGEAIEITWRDFDPHKENLDERIDIYAMAAAGTTAKIFGFSK